MSGALDGTWWLSDGEIGPLRARLTFEDETIDLALSDGGRTTWRFSRDGTAWEARTPEGTSLILDDRGPDTLVVHAGAVVGLAWRTADLPTGLGGAWRWRTPEGTDKPVTFLGGPTGTPGRVVQEGGGTGEVWALRRGADMLSLVIANPGQPPQLWHAHPRDQSWLLWTGTDSQVHTLYRPGKPPIWIPASPTP